MILILGECFNQVKTAAIRYAERYPRRCHPDANVIRRAETRLREMGSTIVYRQNTGRERNVRTVALEEEILEVIEDEPQTSTRVIARQINITHSTVYRVFER